VVYCDFFEDGEVGLNLIFVRDECGVPLVVDDGFLRFELLEGWDSFFGASDEVIRMVFCSDHVGKFSCMVENVELASDLVGSTMDRLSESEGGLLMMKVVIAARMAITGMVSAIFELGKMGVVRRVAVFAGNFERNIGAMVRMTNAPAMSPMAMSAPS